jgi:PAS domain S-box-containing protein
MIDSEGKITFWNQAARRIFGYTEREALGSSLHDLIVPSRFRAAAVLGLTRFRTSGHGEAIGKVSELIGCHKDGTEFPIELSLAALHEGDAWHAVGVVRNITARKAFEREQFENLQFLRTLIETLPNPLYYEDVEGRILGCNQALQDFLDLPAPKVLGKQAKDLLPEAETEWVWGSGYDPAKKLDLHEASFRRTLPDGRVHHAIFRKAPFFQADGEPAGHVATFQDITRLKETEKALRRTESLFSAIHRHVVDLVAIIDGEGKRIYSSPSYQFVLGYSEEEMAARSSMDLLHPDDIERVSTALRGLMEGRPTQGLEYRLRHKDGRWLCFESTAALIPDADADIGAVRALVVARNITERKEAEQSRSAMEVQLRQSQKLEAIGQLAAGIAHEINTPTQYIGDNAAFLRDSFDETFSTMGKLQACLMEIRALGGAAGEVAEKGMNNLAKTDLEYLGSEIPKAIQQSLDGVRRISKIVKAMKDFSHPGGESKTLTDLHQAIESTITVSRNEWKYVANLVTDFDPDLPMVPCYPSEFNQVILNLLVNAAHAIETAKGGRDSGILGQITVTTRALKGEVEVSVSDDGTGIPEAVQVRMFEPFFTTKPVGRGSGQGLAIVHAVIVEKHQGRIEVRSEVGKGTTFILHLPLQGSEAHEEEAK